MAIRKLYQVNQTKGLRKILPEYKKLVNNIVIKLIGENEYKYLTEELKWVFICVDQSRGAAYYDRHVVTIPKWVFLDSRKNYAYYYTAHEIAHIYNKCIDGNGNQHDKGFYTWFTSICPLELQHHELKYKPRYASAAGIRKPKGE